MSEEQLRYTPPGIQGGIVKGAVWEPDRARDVVESLAASSQVVLAEGAEIGTSRLGKKGSSKETGDTAEAVAVEVSVDVFGSGDIVTSVLGEASVESLGGSAVSETVGSPETESREEAKGSVSIQKGTTRYAGLEEIRQSVQDSSSREELRKAILGYESLSTLKKLADSGSHGYSWEQGLLFRHRLDEFGRNRRQLCLPSGYRTKCLELAHEKFGHTGKNTVAKNIQPLFYWPSLWRDSNRHGKSCEACQKTSKRGPRPNPMQEREVVTIPPERVCVDIVGPLPKSKKGYTYLLTYIDVASR